MSTDMSVPPTFDADYDEWFYGSKRRPPGQEQYTDDLPPPPLSDRNSWYYPSHGHDSDEDEARVGTKLGNWGRKSARGARWVRRGKLAAWGPSMEDWEAEERARKRMRLLLPQERRSASPPTLPHLSRSPSPPVTAPYPPPIIQHPSYSSFVMDRSVTHTFRSKLLDELENATNGLIEGEATMKRALGRLWEVINEDPDRSLKSYSVVPKREDDEEEDESEEQRRERRIARAPDLTPIVHKLFLTPYSNGTVPGFEPSHFAPPDLQFSTLEKALASLRELQDDGREYVERLQEIREGLGDIRAQRNGIWDLVRERAIKELQDTAVATAEA
ncbi:hypothetical protein AMATHDRAFT_63591 [Amanita thiersii Skay4041]|uniref:Transcriptional regulatory protein RXT2 N-terminal domain-containing protein n=1 Tax=Amanita thiersii Skay4041 TaxID=703135 RepID=A0A2A9NNG5_9AGAR|nr:hypothetical protein AMATHDRAFT_63591 [Amanita thiersii Skay4041]